MISKFNFKKITCIPGKTIFIADHFMRPFHKFITKSSALVIVRPSLFSILLFSTKKKQEIVSAEEKKRRKRYYEIRKDNEDRLRRIRLGLPADNRPFSEKRKDILAASKKKNDDAAVRRIEELYRVPEDEWNKVLEYKKERKIRQDSMDHIDKLRQAYLDKKARRAARERPKVQPQKSCLSLSLNRILGKNKDIKYFPWIHGKNEDERYIDTKFPQDIVDNKKRRFHMFKYNPISRKSLDLNPRKFFFYKMKRDPVYDSFLLEKIISSFSRHGRKEKIRKVFYNFFLSYKSKYNLNTFYYIINSLSPKYINVPVRSANRYYYAPIRATPFRSTMRGIRFFKMAVLANKYEKSLEEKIRVELKNIFEFWGYVNRFHHDYITISENNKYYAHYRKKRII